MANSSIYAAFERMWQHILAKVGTKADINHTHDDLYYTEVEIDSALLNKADKTHNHDGVYAPANTLESAKTYADSAAVNAANEVKNELLNGAGEAYDTLKELGDLIRENETAIDVLADAKSDWNQNDESALDYVKNRTHWSEVGIIKNVVISPTTDIDISGTSESLNYYYNKTYLVTVDGVEYQCTPYWNFYGEFSLGDSRILMVYDHNIGEEVPDNSNPMDVPFYVNAYYEDPADAGIWFGDPTYYWYFMYPDDSTHTIKIEEIVGEGLIYHKLDENFIPETIARQEYVDAKIEAIPTPDVSGQINSHNKNASAHADIRALIDSNHNSVIETNKGLEQKFWRGTQEEYDVIVTKDDNTMYIITDGEGGSGSGGSSALIGLPNFTTADEGKFLRIVNGVPTWVTIPSVEGVAF